MITDLTVGNPSKKLFWYSIPLLLSVAFQQLYQMADSIIVGRFAETAEAGELALAAVGASYAITQLFVAVATGINIGTGILVSQLFGAKRYFRMKSAVSTALIVTTAVALLLTLMGILGTEPVMRALGTPDNIFSDGALYLRVYVYGLLFLFVYNVCTGIFNAIGDSRTPLVLLILSSVGNVVLDLIFVAVFHWGVAGVAWATFIAQGGAGMLAFFLLLRRLRGFDTGGHFLLFSLDMLRRLLNFSLPSIAQQSFVSVGSVIVQHSVNLYGAIVIAGFAAANRIMTFCTSCCLAIAAGLSNYVAQNAGARKAERIPAGLRASMTYAIGLALMFTLICVVFGGPLVGIFVPAGSESGVIDTGRQFLLIVSPFFAPLCVKLVCDNVLRGAGAMRPFMITTFSDLFLRVGFSLILPHCFGLGATGIWMSWPLGWFLGISISYWFYRTGIWKKHLPTL